MPLAWIFLVAFAGVLLLVALLMAIALLNPVILAIDSTTSQLRVRCLAAVKFWMPFPGTAGERGLSIAGMPIRLPALSAKRKPNKAVRLAAVEAPAPKNLARPRQVRQARFKRFLRRCLAQSSVSVPVAKTFLRLSRGLLRSVALRYEIALCLPDPAWNGMLAGLLAQVTSGKSSAIRMNFIGENAFFLEARLYPHRAVKALLPAFWNLPYRALLKEWRASAAAASS